MNAIFNVLLLLSATTIIASSSSLIHTKNNTNLITTKNDYIFKHIFLGSSNKIENFNQEAEVKNSTIKMIKNVNNLLNGNDSIILEQKHQPDQQKFEEDEISIFYDNETLEVEHKTFVDFYREGITYYLSNDWLGCISSLERAVVLYQDYYNTVTYCRVFCEIERSLLKPTFEENDDHYHFYEGILHKTLCLEKCRREQLKNVPKFFTVDYKDKIAFKQRKAYDYLQICYYKDKEIRKAINAAFTALVGNPKDQMLQKNIKFYASVKDFDYDNMKDLEDKEYSKFYLEGLDKYNRKNWTAVIENFERFIELWVQEYDKCRAFCEDDYQQGWLPDYTMALANQYVYVLRCKQNCTFDLNLINGRTYGDCFASAYDYLQFSYYQVGEIEKAIQCVSSYHLLHPESADMLETLRFYKSIPNMAQKYFQPRKEVKTMVAMRKYEIYLLEFVDNEFAKLMGENIFQEQFDLDDSSKITDSQEDPDATRIQDVKDEANESYFFNIIDRFIKKWRSTSKV